MVPCVYVLRHKDGYRYIGMTVNARNRFVQWVQRFGRTTDWDFAILKQTDDDAERRRIEVAAIRHAAVAVKNGYLLNRAENRNRTPFDIWPTALERPRAQFPDNVPTEILFPCWGKV